MKNILAILFFLPLFSTAQDTCKLKKETDPFTHQTRITTGFQPFSSNGADLAISIDVTSTEIDVFLWFKGDGKCFDDKSTLVVNYEGDRLKANFRNTGSMNCEGAFHFTFRNTPATPGNLERMLSKRISTIVITGNNKTVTEVSLNEEQKNLLRRMFSCIVREGKSLIKQ